MVWYSRSVLQKRHPAKRLIPLPGLGGTDGAISIDMVNFQEFSMDNRTWQATIGAGTLLGDVSTRLHKAGGRAIAHGTCPGVGMGGHATIVSATATESSAAAMY